MGKRRADDPPPPAKGEPYIFPDNWTRAEILDALKESEETRTKLLAERDRWRKIADESLWRLARVEASVAEMWQIIAREPKPSSEVTR